MNEEIFRKKSLDKVKSPEDLDDYIRVTNPGVIILLISVIVLLVGAFIWGVYGYMESTIDVNIIVDNQQAGAYIEDEEVPLVKEGMSVRFADSEGTVTEIKEEKYWGYYVLIELNSDVPNGNYDGEIILSRYRPINLVFN